MANNKLRLQTLNAGMTVYAIFSTRDGKVYRSNGTTEAYATANLALYAVAAGAEEGVASRAYVLTIPANLPVGGYTVDAFKRVGGAPAEGDPLVWQSSGFLYWDGDDVRDAYDVVNNGAFGNAAIMSLVDSLYLTQVGPSGTVQDLAATTTSFKTSLTDATGVWNDASLVFVAGANDRVSRIVVSFTQPNGVVTFDEPLPFAPVNGDNFYMKISHAHTKTQIAAAVDTQLSGTHGAGSWEAATSTGARTVTITVNDGSAALEGALVRVTKGALTYADNTDVAGQVTFNLDDGTWTVAITLAGYTFAGATLAVAADTTHTYSMTANNTTPSAPARVTGYLYCYDEDGVAEVGVEIRCQATGGTTAGGVAHDATVRTETSGAGGYVEFTNLLPGATYDFWRGITTTRKVSVTIPADAATPYALSDVIGRP